jgi:secretion/DNA translocation related TadE-like protein
MTARLRRGGRDDGAGTVLALSLVALLSCLVLAAAALGSAVVARHRASAAADLAALAGADRALGRATGSACPAAAAVAAAGGAALTGCTTGVDGSVTVTVAVRLPAPWASLGTAAASARAGRPP